MRICFVVGNTSRTRCLILADPVLFAVLAFKFNTSRTRCLILADPPLSSGQAEPVLAVLACTFNRSLTRCLIPVMLFYKAGWLKSNSSINWHVHFTDVPQDVSRLSSISQTG